MIGHVVLFQPRGDLSPSQQAALLKAMRLAFTNIPEIRRARIGRRRLVGRAYELDATVDFRYAAIIEFETQDALRTYLEHPAHLELGRQFGMTAQAALVYDYELVDAERVEELLD